MSVAQPAGDAASSSNNSGPDTSRDFFVGLPGPVYRLVRAFARALARVYWRLDVRGLENVPLSGPVIIAPVHRSFVDFLVAACVTRRKVFFMAKDSLFRSKGFGRFLESLGAFPVNRDGADRLAIERSQAILERGEALILFPEGQRRFGTVVEDLHEGAAFLAARTGASIVPVGIGGTAEAMPKGKTVPRPVKVHAVIGPPIPAPLRSERGRVARHQVHAVTERLTQELQALFDDARSLGR